MPYNQIFYEVCNDKKRLNFTFIKNYKHYEPFYDLQNRIFWYEGVELYITS